MAFRAYYYGQSGDRYGSRHQQYSLNEQFLMALLSLSLLIFDSNLVSKLFLDFPLLIPNFLLMKNLVATSFMVLIDSLILIYLFGILLMLSLLIFNIPSQPLFLAIILLSASISIFYHLSKFKNIYHSFGDSIIDHFQNSKLRLSSILLSIMILITLLACSTILLSIFSQDYTSLKEIMFFVLPAGCLYYGIKNLVKNPTFLPLALLIAGLIFSAFALEDLNNLLLSKNTMFRLYIGLAMVWLFVGLLFISQSKE